MNKACLLLVSALAAPMACGGSTVEGMPGVDGGGGSQAGGSGGGVGGASGNSSSGPSGTSGAGGATGGTSGGMGGGGTSGGMAGSGTSGGMAGVGGASPRDAAPASDAADASPKMDAEAGTDAGSGGQGGAGGSADAGSLFPCLPNGEEHLAIHIVGTPSLDVTDPAQVQCFSRYNPATDAGGALLDFNWNIGTGTISAVVRLDGPLPGMTGTFDPFSVLIAEGSNGWLGLQGKCHVSVNSSQRIGTASPAAYKVSGSVACDPEWALGKPEDVLRQFEFTTRVAGYP